MQQNHYKMSLPSCPICSKNYDLYYHVPRVLPKCGHTFCQKCIKSKMMTRKGRLTFICQQCQCQVIIRKNVSNQLPTNITITEMIKNFKFKNLEPQASIAQSNNLCRYHSKKLEMICLTCENMRICPHCAVFGEHKNHNISEEEKASYEDVSKLKESIEAIEEMVKLMLLPDSSSNLQKCAKSKLSSTLQMQIKQNFKGYYNEIVKKQSQLLQQCESVMIQNKIGQSIDSILTSFDILKLKGKDVKILNKSELQGVIQNARQLNSQIQKIVQSFQKSIQIFLQQSKNKIREVIFFQVQLLDKRNLKAILKGNTTPDHKHKDKNFLSAKTIQSKKDQATTKKIYPQQALQHNIGNNLTSNFTQKIQKTKSIHSHPPLPHSSEGLSGTHEKSKKFALPNERNRDEEVVEKEKAKEYRSQIVATEEKVQKQVQNGVTSKLNKFISVKKGEQTVKSPVKPNSREPSPPIENEIDLKFIKPNKQINYEHRSKLQSIITEIDRQPPEGSLELIGLQITDPLIPYICDYLKTKKLQYSMIKLVKNNISDEGFHTLLSYLSNDRFAQVLNLTGNQITQKSLLLIVSFITHNNILKTIYLSNNKISPHHLKKIKKQLDLQFVQVVL